MRHQARSLDVHAGIQAPPGASHAPRVLSMLGLALALLLLAGCTAADPAPAQPTTAPPPATTPSPHPSTAPSPEPTAVASASGVGVAPLPIQHIATPVPLEPTAQPPATATPAPTQDPTRPDDPALRDARRHVSNGDLRAALSAYQRLIEERGDEPLLLFEQGIARLAAGEAEAALEGFRRVLALSPEEPLLGRARLMEATASLALGDGRGMLELPVDQAPDGLGDLLALRRAEAALKAGRPGDALEELSAGALAESVNRIILRDAARLARQQDAHGLTAELYARSSLAPAWTAQRSATMEAAAAAFARAGDRERSVEQYRALIELFGWTASAQRAAAELERLGGSTPYHVGLLALHQRRYAEARVLFDRAAAGGEHAAQAASRLRELAEAEAWREADFAGTRAAYQSFVQRYPSSTRAAEARFQEGFVLYQAGQISAALAVWDGALGTASGDNLARLHLWSGIALERLGRGEEAQARLKQAAAVRPAGYYSIRAQDRLAGVRGWPGQAASSTTSGDIDPAKAEAWIAEWAGGYDPVELETDERARRGLGLAALGLREEATAEMNALIADSSDPNLLFPLALRLAEEELWYSAARAGLRLTGLSPEKTVTEVPAAVQRLVYSLAYWDLVEAESKRYGLDPLLFLSLVYQESRYDPDAISLAEARGLTQVIPSTGRGIASALGRSGFEPEQLYQPVTSVQFGTWYLATQLRSFGGNTIKALAAYNAGAGPVGRWASDDLDLFVERIDYAETKGYVRQIYLHHAIFRELGAGS
jgi:soluble lytic murein transglycosylase-like protein